MPGCADFLDMCLKSTERIKKVADRSFNLLADGTPVPFAGSARLEGEDSLSLFPALFRLELRNLPEETYLRLSRAKTLSVSHEGACLVSGRITDTFRRTAPGGTTTEIAVCAGLDLWKARVSLSVPKGTRVSETVRKILEDSGTSISLLANPSPDPEVLRPGCYCGRAAECIERALSAAGCRAVLTPAGIMPVPKGGLETAWRLTPNDLPEEPAFAGGAASGETKYMVLIARLSGWRPGETIEVNCGRTRARGIIVRRAVSADTAAGEWKAELLAETI